jgi:hypothetical protein
VNRRHYLASLGVAVGLGGCLSDGADTGTATPDEDPGTGPGSEASPSTTPATDGPPSPTPTPLSSDTQGTPNPTPPPIDVETPAPGECEAPPRPKPETGEGLPEPRDYPDPPEGIELETVKSYLEAYENAYRYNYRLADLAEDGACVEYFETEVTGSTVWQTDRGIVAEVLTTGSYTGTACSDPTGTDSPTPLPHADFFTQPAYYLVTEEFLVVDGTVVECWE